jgi:integrase
MVFKVVLADYTKQDGSRNVCVYLYQDGKKAIIATDHFILPGQFDKGKVKKHPNADYLNAELDAFKSKLQLHALKNPGVSPADIKKWYEGGVTTLFEFIDHFIKGIRDQTILIKGKRSMNKGKPYAPNSIKSIVTYTNYLKEFDPGLNWNDITEDFLTRYLVWMRKDGYSENTIAKAVKTLVMIMGRGKKYHSSTDYLEFEASYVETDTIFLNEAEIELIRRCKLPKELRGERDRFLLSYNFFLRFGDSLTIDRKDIFTEDGAMFARLMDEKTKNIRIVPLLPGTLEILKACDFKLSKTTNQESNWKLKEIGKKAGIDSIYTQITVKDGTVHRLPACKYNFITTHTAKRSITTNIYLSMVKNKNVDLKKLQLMGGWKSVSMLERYLKVDKLVNALSAAGDPFFN